MSVAASGAVCDLALKLQIAPAVAKLAVAKVAVGAVAVVGLLLAEGMLTANSRADNITSC